MFGSVELYHVNICRQLSSYWYQSIQSTSAAGVLINYPLTLNTWEHTSAWHTLHSSCFRVCDNSAFYCLYVLVVPLAWLRSGLHFDCVICCFISLLQTPTPSVPRPPTPLIALTVGGTVIFWEACSVPSNELWSFVLLFSRRRASVYVRATGPSPQLVTRPTAHKLTLFIAVESYF